MFESLALPILLVVANVAGAGMVLPQVLRLYRTRTADGVSAAGSGVGVIMNLWWVGYAVAQGLWGLLPVAVGGAVLYAVVGLLLIQIVGRHSIDGIARGQLIGTIPLVGLVGWGWTGAGLTIGLLYGAQFAPALIAALRSPSVRGISATMWLLAWIEAVIWLVYGLAEQDLALVLGGGGGTIMASLILTRLTPGLPLGPARHPEPTGSAVPLAA